MNLLLMLLYLIPSTVKRDGLKQNLPKKVEISIHTEKAYKILTYNVWGLPVFLPGHEDDLRFPSMADSILKRQPDILCLQEVFSVYFRSQNLEKLKNQYYYGSDYNCSQSIIPFVYKDCHGGLATFSVFPIEDEKFYEYPVFPGMRWEEKIGAKGFLLTKIDLPSGKIWVVNTHLYSGPSRNDEAIRLSQVKYMMEVLEGLDLKLPIMMAGDFNIAHPGLSNNKMKFPNDVYSILQSRWHFNDAVHQYSKAQQWYTIHPESNKYCNSSEGNQKLDYIFFKNYGKKCINILHNAVEMKGVATLSDHHAFASVFNLE